MKTVSSAFALPLVVALATIAVQARASAPDCARLEAARDRAWQQLRHGHGAATANRLHARIRALNEQIAQHCH